MLKGGQLGEYGRGANIRGVGTIFIYLGMLRILQTFIIEFVNLEELAKTRTFFFIADIKEYYGYHKKFLLRNIRLNYGP